MSSTHCGRARSGWRGRVCAHACVCVCVCVCACVRVCWGREREGPQLLLLLLLPGGWGWSQTPWPAVCAAGRPGRPPRGSRRRTNLGQPPLARPPSCHRNAVIHKVIRGIRKTLCCCCCCCCWWWWWWWWWRLGTRRERKPSGGQHQEGHGGRRKASREARMEGTPEQHVERGACRRRRQGMSLPKQHPAVMHHQQCDVIGDDVWSGRQISDIKCCCQPLSGVPYLRHGPHRAVVHDRTAHGKRCRRHWTRCPRRHHRRRQAAGRAQGPRSLHRRPPNGPEGSVRDDTPWWCLQRPRCKPSKSLSW